MILKGYIHLNTVEKIILKGYIHLDTVRENHFKGVYSVEYDR